jgi:hypothetical protein
MSTDALSATSQAVSAAVQQAAPLGALPPEASLDTLSHAASTASKVATDLPSMGLVILFIVVLAIVLMIVPRFIGEFGSKIFDKAKANQAAATPSPVVAPPTTAPIFHPQAAPTPVQLGQSGVTGALGNDPTEAELVAILAAAAADVLGVCVSQVQITNVHEDHSWRMQGRTAIHHSHRIR